MKIIISQTKNGYIIYEPDASSKHAEVSVAETMETLALVIADRFGVNLDSKIEEEKLPPMQVIEPIEEIQNVENDPVNDDEEDEEVFVIPAVATGGEAGIQEREVYDPGDAPERAPEERLSEPPQEEGYSRSTAWDINTGSDRQSEAPKQQPYTPENTGLSEMQLSVLQIICHLVDLDQGPVSGGDINERMTPPPSNLTTLMQPLIKKGFIKKRTEGRAVTYTPLKRPDGRKYDPLPVTDESGVPVIHCEPRNVGSRSNSEGGLKI